MGSRITDTMKNTPLQDISEHCFNCTKVNWDETENMEIINNNRLKCMQCKNTKVGIYKFDAIRTAKKFKEKFFGTGRKSLIEKNYGNTIRSLIKEGKTQKEIAEIINMSVVSINKFCKKNNLGKRKVARNGKKLGRKKQKDSKK